ncbi:MAG TPA: CheR family methyltransferase [Azospirillum sp.]|nr:CheR family methyltransferase [Azospirillum sp.]
MRRTVCKRLAKRLSELNLRSLDDYRIHLGRTPGEWQRLDALCRIPISRFYRDKGVFDDLGCRVLPELAADAALRDLPRLRCWSAGAASGEEPYTLALVWTFQVGPAFPAVRLSVIATEADPVMLERAQDGLYPAGALKDLPGGWRERAFHPVNGQFRLDPALRAGVTLRLQDIRDGQPDGPFDLILCRNLVFTYFDPSLQGEMLVRFRERLRPGGYLVLGNHETLPPGADAFQAGEGAMPIFRLIRATGGAAP